MPIKMLMARQIYDVNGNPTLEVDLVTELGLFRTGVPNTDRKLVSEMVQIRDNNPNEHHGLGVTQAVKHINNIIAPELIKQNLEVTNQREIDTFMINLDNTDSRCRLGANAMMVVSMVIAKAGAAKKGIPLYRHISDLAGISSIIMPVPHFVMISGGIASGNALPYLEYTAIPSGAANFTEAYRLGTDIYRQMRQTMEARYGKSSVFVSENGGLNPPIQSHRDCLMFFLEILKTLGYEKKVDMGLNACGSVMFKDGVYDMDFKNPQSNPQDYLTSDKLGEIYTENAKEFGVVSLEDPFDPDDWSSWSLFTAKTTMQIIGSDLTQTNLRRCTLAVEKKAIHCCGIKLNQCSTITEIIDVYKLLKSQGLAVIVEDRIGDTDDLFLADLVVGLAAGQIKCGAPCRGERVGKYNHILRIEEELGALAKYAGRNYRTINAHP